MEYNTSRPQLKLSEYGRNIQKLIEHALTIKDDEERNKMAKIIVSAMGQLNPSVKEYNDFRHKLWDHLFMISDFELKVDSPYPKPSKEDKTIKPGKISYPTYRVPFRHYGNTLFKMMDEACKIEEGPKKDMFINQIANYMKQSYVNYNRDNVNDEVIFSQLSKLSEGQLNVKENVRLAQARELPLNVNVNRNKKKKKNRRR